MCHGNILYAALNKYSKAFVSYGTSLVVSERNRENRIIHVLNSSSYFFSLESTPNLRYCCCLALVLTVLLKSNDNSCPRKLQIHL